MRKVVTAAAGVLLLATAACGSRDSDPMVQVCVEINTNHQVDEDHCEEGESEYEPRRFGVVWLRQSLVTNQDAVVEPETDETKKKTSKPTPKQTTKKSTTTTKRR